MKNFKITIRSQFRTLNFVGGIDALVSGDELCRLEIKLSNENMGSKENTIRKVVLVKENNYQSHNLIGEKCYSVTFLERHYPHMDKLVSELKSMSYANVE